MGKRQECCFAGSINYIKVTTNGNRDFYYKNPGFFLQNRKVRLTRSKNRDAILGNVAQAYNIKKCNRRSCYEGRKSGQKFKTEKLLKMTFIDKSVTGMYERRFKINGMENSNSKQKLQIKL